MTFLCGQSNALWHYLAGRYPGSVGQLLGPSYWRKQKLRDWMPFCLDNDAFSAWAKHVDWDEAAWHSMLRGVKATGLRPVWCLVPDKVADAKATIELYYRYHLYVKDMGWDTAFAVQDGMSPDYVPTCAKVVFVGGTTEWKWKTLPMWLKYFSRVHVGRVTNRERMLRCIDLGVESIDGSGWFMGTSEGVNAVGIRAIIEGSYHTNMELALDGKGGGG